MINRIFCETLGFLLKQNQQLDLSALEGGRYVIEIKELPEPLAFTVLNHEILPLTKAEMGLSLDVKISGDLQSVLGLFRPDFHDDGLYITGKISRAKQLQAMLAGLSFDAPRFFAQVAPQSLAPVLTDCFYKGKSQISAARDVLTSHCFASQAEFDALVLHIQILHTRLDALLDEVAQLRRDIMI